VIVLFKLDRRGERVHTTYDHELVMEDPEFVPGLNDIVRLSVPGIDGRLPRIVYKRSYEIDESGDQKVTIYADDMRNLLGRLGSERREENARLNLWR
jgi:hypothetical protein